MYSMLSFFILLQQNTAEVSTSVLQNKLDILDVKLR